MVKVEITEWGELSIIEELLSDYALRTSDKKDPRAVYARRLLERVRPVLVEATEKL